MSKVMRIWVTLGVALIATTLLWSLPQAKAQTPNYFEFNGISIGFPKAYKTVSDKQKKWITSESADGKVRYVLIPSELNNFDEMHEKILKKFFSDSYVGLEEAGEEHFEGEDVGFRKLTFNAKSKSGATPVIITAQFSILLRNDAAKGILLIGVVRQDAAEEYADAINEIFEGVSAAGEMAKTDEPVVAAKPAAPAPVGKTPAPKPAPAASAGNCPGSKLTDAEVREILREHNEARAAVNLAPLTWNCQLADFAQKWANRGIFEHSTNEQRGAIIPNGSAGENLAAWWSPTSPPSVGGWIEEKQFWNNAAATCATGKVCGHYTQVVWKDTTQIGCGINRQAPGDFQAMLVCNYNPAGNYGGPAY